MNMQSDSSGDLFGPFYFANNCGEPYSRSERWIQYFDRVASRLVADFHPKTVLDAGCAWGLLVECLRARGVEAYGIDISEYAIQNVHPDIQKYCRVGSITEPLPQRYDLIISIEVMEHMPPQDSERAIANLCQYTDNIILSTTPFDYKEATHLNVQPPDYWARHFARHQFIHDLDYDASNFLPHWAARYYRVPSDPLQAAAQAYERKLFKLQSEVYELRSAVVEYHQKLEASEQDARQAEEQRLELENELSKPRQAAGQVGEENIEEMTQQLESTQKQLQDWEERWHDMEQGRGWQMLQRIQSIRLGLFPPGSQREKILDRIITRKGK